MLRSVALAAVAALIGLGLMASRSYATEDDALFQRYQNLCLSYGTNPSPAILGCSVLRFSPGAVRRQVVEMVEERCQVRIQPLCDLPQSRPEAERLIEALGCQRFSVSCEDRRVTSNAKRLGPPRTSQEFRERLDAVRSDMRVGQAYSRWLALERERQTLENVIVTGSQQTKNKDALSKLVATIKEVKELVDAISSANLAIFAQKKALKFFADHALSIPDGAPPQEQEDLQLKAAEAHRAWSAFIQQLTRIDPDLAEFMSPTGRILETATVWPYEMTVDPNAGRPTIRVPRH